MFLSWTEEKIFLAELLYQEREKSFLLDEKCHFSHTVCSIFLVTLYLWFCTEVKKNKNSKKWEKIVKKKLNASWKKTVNLRQWKKKLNIEKNNEKVTFYWQDDRNE